MGSCHSVGPDQMMVISGGCCGASKKRYLTGQCAFAWCLVTEVQWLNLGIMTILPSVRDCESAKGVRVNVTAVAQVKVMMDSKEYYETACEQFMGRRESDMKKLILGTLEGHLRAIIGTMTVEELFQDRESFAHNVREVASTDISKMGIKIMSFTVKELSDSDGYLDALGQEQTAKIKSKADIESAEAESEAFVYEKGCEKISMDTRYSVDKEIADYERNFSTKQSQYAAVVNTAQAASSLAYDLQSQKQQQLIVAEELNVELVEKQMSIKVEEQEIIRSEKELTATTRLPADADAYQTTVIAEGERIAKLRQAEGEAQRIRLIGEADASAIEAIGKAEASEMFLKASAYKEYGKAAKIKMVVDCLPKIAAEVVAPLEKVDDIVIVGGGDGAAQLLATLPVNKNRKPSKTDQPAELPVATGMIDAGLRIAGGMKIIESMTSGTSL